MHRQRRLVHCYGIDIAFMERPGTHRRVTSLDQEGLSYGVLAAAEALTCQNFSIRCRQYVAPAEALAEVDLPAVLLKRAVCIRHGR